MGNSDLVLLLTAGCLIALAAQAPLNKRRMHLAYYDESGDDGFPQRSTDLFVLSCIYMRPEVWRKNFEAVQTLRRKLAVSHRFRFDWELHTREWLLAKHPYYSAAFSTSDRIDVVDRFVALLAGLDLRCINVVINKTLIRKADYNVLDHALTYSIQRVHNDMRTTGSHFIIISDEGRIGKMRSTARRLQKINFVPSQFGPDVYRQDLKFLIEDPLPKNSSESHFIQLADMIACIVSLWSVSWLGVGRIPNRMAFLPPGQPESWLTTLSPVLNLKASSERFGIYAHPRTTPTPTTSGSP